MVQLADRLTMDAPRRTREGFMAVRAKAARTGTYDYLGSEIDPDNAHGLRDAGMVKVLRDEATVFDAAAVHSFIGKPVTIDHPAQAVTAANWKDHASGTVMGAKWEPGGYLAFDLMLTDAAAIAAIDAGKRELSNGYETTLEFGDFKAADGTSCVARQTRIRGNHVALVDKGRAGPDCAIRDRFAPCDANLAVVDSLQPKETSMKKIVLDGLQVDLSDADAVAAAISKLQDAAKVAVQATADAKAELSTAAGTIAALEKSLADEKVKTDPAALDRMVADRAALVAKAKAVKADIVTDGQTDAEIRKAVVTAKLGDAAAALDDAGIAGAFAVLAIDAKADPVRLAVATGGALFTDTAELRDAFRHVRTA